jgi:hypothetical protein
MLEQIHFLVPRQKFLALLAAAFVTPQLNPGRGDLAPVIHAHRPVHLTAAAHGRHGRGVNPRFLKDGTQGLTGFGPPGIGTLLRPVRMGTVKIVGNLMDTQDITFLRHDCGP